MIIAVIVPALGAQSLTKVFHRSPRQFLKWIWRFGESRVTEIRGWQAGRRSRRPCCKAKREGSARRPGRRGRFVPDRAALLAEADQREVSERRHGAPLDQRHALGARRPGGVTRKGEFGTPAELARRRLEPMLERPAQA